MSKDNQQEKTTLPNISVGQVLYIQEKRRNAPPEIIEVTVTKIGRKYFYINRYRTEYPISKETLQYEDKNYSQSNFQLYLDKQEILDTNERQKLLDVLQKHFSWSNNGTKENTLEQLRKVAEILGLS
jgi:hypothetical protein